MNTEREQHSLGRGWLLALSLALPVVLLLGFAVLRWGKLFLNLIHVLMKLVVIA